LCRRLDGGDAVIRYYPMTRFLFELDKPLETEVSEERATEFFNYCAVNAPADDLDDVNLF
jgi:hypothetical protein